jgi:hypothetical protein
VPRSRNEWSYTSTPTINLDGMVLSLKKAQTRLYSYFFYDIRKNHLFLKDRTEERRIRERIVGGKLFFLPFSGRRGKESEGTKGRKKKEK